MSIANCTQMVFVLQRANPFKFKHVRQLGRPRDLEGVGPCVVLATPSMLQSGLSRYPMPPPSSKSLVTIPLQAEMPSDGLEQLYLWGENIL